MGNLMKDSKKFNTLVKTYNNFLTPAMKIKVDGKDIRSSMKVGITDLNVSLMLDEASSANFTIVNIYDREKSSFVSEVKSKLKLGSVIIVELGYDSTLTTVFKGYIANLTMQFNDIPTISVTALDARRLMMDNVRSHFTLTGKNYTDVVKTVLGSYKKICSKQKIDPTKDNLTQVMQNESDYNLINDCAEKANREFFIIDDTAYFRKKDVSSAPITTLEWGKGLISFTSRTSFCNEMIMVKRKLNDKDIMVKKPAKSENSAKALVSPLPVRQIKEYDFESKEAGTAIVDYNINERLSKCRTGSGTCIGLPEIIPGRYLKVDKLDASINKAYYLTQVTHNFGGDGYTTEFEIGGWK